MRRGEIFELVERYRAAWLAHDVDAIMSVLTEDVVFHNLTADERVQGADAVSAGQAFIEGGSEPMMVSNEGSATAVDVATQVAPAGSPFRVEDDPPSCAS